MSLAGGYKHTINTQYVHPCVMHAGVSVGEPVRLPEADKGMRCMHETVCAAMSDVFMRQCQTGVECRVVDSTYVLIGHSEPRYYIVKDGG